MHLGWDNRGLAILTSSLLNDISSCPFDYVASPHITVACSLRTWRLSGLCCLQLVKDTTIAALIWLGQKEHAFLFWNKEYKTYEPTSFGKAVLASGLAPEMCMTIKVGDPRTTT